MQTSTTIISFMLPVHLNDPILNTYRDTNNVIPLINAIRTLMLISVKRHLFFSHVSTDSSDMHSTDFVTDFILLFSSLLWWSSFISEIVPWASRKVNFLFRARRFLLHLTYIRYTKLKSTPNLSTAAPCVVELRLLLFFITIVHNKKPQSLTHRRRIISRSFFHRNYADLCSSQSFFFPANFHHHSHTQEASHSYPLSLL